MSERREKDPDLGVLVRKAGKGDEAAQAELIRSHQDRLLRFCIYLCGDRNLAQDLCQESLIKALGNLKQLRDPEGFTGWLLKSAKNLYLDHVKSPRNQKHADLDGEAVPPEAVREESKADVIIQVQTALGQLKPEERMLLILIDMEGHSYAEAAEIIGITEANVRFRLHHVRKAFLKLYNK